LQQRLLDDIRRIEFAAQLGSQMQPGQQAQVGAEGFQQPTRFLRRPVHVRSSSGKDANEALFGREPGGFSTDYRDFILRREGAQRREPVFAPGLQVP
jgi:hypothetical protein